MSTTSLPPPPQSKLDVLRASNPFLDGPGEFLCKSICDELAKVRAFRAAFGSYIDPYMRMDYPLSALPALRVYSPRQTKTGQTWWITGDVMLDVIWPASLRREELQTLPDMIGNALIQQFRRVSFFNAVLALVPGLNWLGQEVAVDKTAGFELKDGEIVPLTQIVANFRIDVSAWDRYLETQAREVDTPFEKTLQDLASIIVSIGGVREDTDLTLGSDVAEVTVGIEIDPTTPED